MSGRRKGKTPPRQPARQVNPGPAVKTPQVADVAEEIDQRHVAAGEPEPPESSGPAGGSDIAPGRLLELWSKARALEAKYLSDAERVSAEALRVQTARSENEAARKDARDEQSAAAALKLSLDERQDRIDADDAALLEREELVADRETAAEGGFLEQRRASLQAFYAEKAKLLDEIGELQVELFKQQQDLPRLVKERLDEVSSQHQTELDEQRQQIEDSRQELDRERAQVQSDRDRHQRDTVSLAAREFNLQEDEALVVARAEAKAGALLEQERLRADQLSRRLDATSVRLHATEQQLQDASHAKDQFSGRSAAEVLRELERLHADNAGLEDRLANALGGEAVARLRQLEAEKQRWSDERLDLVQESQELRALLERARTAVGDLELARDTVRSLEVRIAAYKQAISDQRSDWEQLVEQGRADLPFPECSRMDEAPECQSPPARLSSPENLKSLVAEVRSRMASLPGPDARYYSEADVRVFLGGLAMSQLHLLQGISGTGKTSLPLAFASAIGAGKAVVEVQAGWRDRDDLLGHFNAFEGKFYEKDITQALYRAQCPAYSARPFFVVLDEMNLSHPEQYFADFLSELEQSPSGRRVALRTERTVGAPLLLQDGRFLRIPPNVWFIGTANHDETTVGFADKTYDRAHVMELPHHHEEFKPSRVRSPQPVKYEAMQGLFNDAARDFKESADLVNVYLTADVGDVLRDRFGVGWGNRLVGHVKTFVPVVVAADGDVGEATDHLLSTKLLRKVRDRHDVLPEDFEALQEAIESSWTTLGPEATAPDKSLRIVAQELRRLGVTLR